MRGWWVLKAKFACEVEICFEMGVKTEVGSQVGPIVGVCYVMVVLVDNVVVGSSAQARDAA